MVTNRGRDGPDRTTGLRSGSNGEGAIFALTFAAIDTIVIHLSEPIFIVLQPVSTFAVRGKVCYERQGRYP